MQIWLFRINCFVKEIIFAECWTRHDIELFSNQLYYQKIAFVVRLIIRYFFAIRLVRDLITRHDCSNQLFHQMNCIYKTLNASRHMIVRINCIVKKIVFVVLLIFKYVFAVWFDRDLLYNLFLTSDYFLSMSMFYKWYVNFNNEIFFFFLVWIFSVNKTTFWIQSYNKFISWIFWTIEKFSFLDVLLRVCKLIDFVDSKF